MKKSVLFFCFVALATFFVSCNKVGKNEFIDPKSMFSYLEDNNLKPSAPVDLNDGTWQKVIVGVYQYAHDTTFCYRKIYPDDTTKIIVMIPAGSVSKVDKEPKENEYLFSLNAAKEEVTKQGKFLPNAEQATKIKIDIEKYQCQISPKTGIYKYWNIYSPDFGKLNGSVLYNSGYCYGFWTIDGVITGQSGCLICYIDPIAVGEWKWSTSWGIHDPAYSTVAGVACLSVRLFKPRGEVHKNN